MMNIVFKQIDGADSIEPSNWYLEQIGLRLVALSKRMSAFLLLTSSQGELAQRNSLDVLTLPPRTIEQWVSLRSTHPTLATRWIFQSSISRACGGQSSQAGEAAGYFD